MNLKPRRSEEPEVNLTSLIDVVLLLVVFFMLSSTFIDEGRVKIKLPEANASKAVKSATEPLVITVTREGVYRLNDRELVNSSAATLRNGIVKLVGDERNVRVTIRADADSRHQAVVTVMDVLSKLGFGQINIATVESTAGSP
ncbi:MAG: biopolymer transporter ExbD [Steroidobacteraceae bacterium]